MPAAPAAVLVYAAAAPAALLVYAGVLQVCRLGERSLKSLKQFFARDEDESFRWRIAASLRAVNTLGNAMTTVRATTDNHHDSHTDAAMLC
eukprot:COSAG06_NODE_4949_length_3837_cov_3.397059_5_plen_91_part_00